MSKIIDLDGLTEYDTKLKEYLSDNFIESSNQSIKNIIELTYAQYKTLEDNDEIDPNTEYHIKENGTGTSGGGFDPIHTPGYDPTKVQVLKNVNGVLQWVDDIVPNASSTDVGGVKVYTDANNNLYITTNGDSPIPS